MGWSVQSEPAGTLKALAAALFTQQLGPEKSEHFCVVKGDSQSFCEAPQCSAQ